MRVSEPEFVVRMNTKARTTIIFTHLPAGKYSLTVRPARSLALLVSAYNCMLLVRLFGSLGLTTRYSFSCYLMPRALDNIRTGTCSPYVTTTINTIPTTITTLLILTVQTKRLCIATHSVYLVLNNN